VQGVEVAEAVRVMMEPLGMPELPVNPHLDKLREAPARSTRLEAQTHMKIQALQQKAETAAMARRVETVR